MYHTVDSVKSALGRHLGRASNQETIEGLSQLRCLNDSNGGRGDIENLMSDSGQQILLNFSC